MPSKKKTTGKTKSKTTKRKSAARKARIVAPSDRESAGMTETLPVEAVVEPVPEIAVEVAVVEAEAVVEAVVVQSVVIETPVVEPAPARKFSLKVVTAAAPKKVIPAPVYEPPVRDLVSTESSRGEIDAFGRDPDFEQKAEKALEFLYRRYFRVSTRNIENVPDKGPVLLVANHSGSLPLDGAMLKLALSLDHPAHRRLRPLAENFVYHFPFVGTLLNRFGAVRACQENAEALLDEGEAVAVFPEGVKGLGKPFRKRYQLQRFGRGGFIKLAIRTGAPIIPVAIVGAEETNPVIARLVRPGRTLGLPYLPITPTFPFLGPVGLLPLPTKWTIEFGEPMKLDADESADDLTIAKLTEDIRGDIQGRIDRLLSQRTGWFR